MSAKKIPTIDQLHGDSRRFYDVLSQENDVACVVTSIAYLDQCVASLVGHFLVAGDTSKQLLHYSGPVGAFTNRTNLAYCLGLIPKGMQQNLHRFADIRNQFAHSHLDLSFAEPQIADLCNKLTLLAMLKGLLPDAKATDNREKHEWNSEFRNSPRLRFVTVASLTAMQLLAFSGGITPCEKKSSGWEPDPAPPDHPA